MTKTTANRAYGWVPDVPDQRDQTVALGAPIPLPPSVDLRDLCPPVYDQGQLGSCTANAIAAAFDVERKKQNEPFLTPSRLFIYYNERLAEGTTRTDSGAQIRDGIKVVNQVGVPPESLWPYDTSKFALKPSAAAYKAAKNTEALAYSRVPQAQISIQQVLAGGHPIVVGFSVYESFESEEVAATGVMPMPSPFEQCLGGHAVLVVGYEERQGHLYAIVRNSWSAAWGDAGYFYMPFEVLTTPSLSQDFWTITRTA